jgi:hypothetical protein
MVNAENGSNNYDASTLRTVCSEYNRLLQNTQIFSKLHRMGGKYNTMTGICNLMIFHFNQLLHRVIWDDANNNFDDFTVRTLSSEYNRLLQNTRIFSNCIEWVENTIQ